MIVEQLRALAVPVSNLVNDPDNANMGRVDKIANSLRVFGQRKPVVVRRTGTDENGHSVGIIEAGNHTYQAALELGWTEIAAVFVDDDATQAKAYGLTDNRTGELAAWDYERLADHLAELGDVDGFDMEVLGWEPGELSNLLNAQWDPEDDGGDLEDFTRSDKRAGGMNITLTTDAAVFVKEAIDMVREREGNPNMTEEEALVAVARFYTNSHRTG